MNSQSYSRRTLILLLIISIITYKTSSKCLLQSEIESRLSYEANTITPNKAILIIVIHKANLQLNEISDFERIAFKVKSTYVIDDCIRICKRNDEEYKNSRSLNRNDMYLISNSRIIKNSLRFDRITYDDIYEFLYENDIDYSIDSIDSNNHSQYQSYNENHNDCFVFLQKSMSELKIFNGKDKYIVLIMILYFLSFMILLVLCRLIIIYAISSKEELIKLKNIKARRVLSNIQYKFMYNKPLY